MLTSIFFFPPTLIFVIHLSTAVTSDVHPWFGSTDEM